MISALLLSYVKINMFEHNKQILIFKLNIGLITMFLSRIVLNYKSSRKVEQKYEVPT